MIFIMRKNKPSNFIAYIIYVIYAVIILILPVFIYSCEKKEPEAQPDTDDVMKKIAAKFPEYENSKTIYKSGGKSTKLSDKSAMDLYSEDKSKPVDLSKIEQYSVYISEDESIEIGIFKLYDKTNAEYVKDMAHTRISKIQKDMSNEITNNAETRSYGNYVYYASHSRKDKIFEIIENALKGGDDK